MHAAGREAGHQPQARPRAASKPSAARNRAVALLPRPAPARRSGPPTPGQQARRHRMPPRAPPRGPSPPGPRGAAHARRGSPRRATSDPSACPRRSPPTPTTRHPGRLPECQRTPPRPCPRPSPRSSPGSPRPRTGPRGSRIGLAATRPGRRRLPAHGNSGPMYIWNPATNSSPFPAADDGGRMLLRRPVTTDSEDRNMNAANRIERTAPRDTPDTHVSISGACPARLESRQPDAAPPGNHEVTCVAHLR